MPRDRFVMTPEELAEYNKQVEKRKLDARNFLAELKERVGYEAVADLRALGLTEEQAKQIRWTGRLTERRSPTAEQFWKAARPDSTEAKALIGINSDGTFRSDIFSPAEYEGHGGNHDFNNRELEESLEFAKNAPEYKSPRE
jgi:hypothetical protein